MLVILSIVTSLANACEKSAKQSFELSQQKWQAAKLDNYSYVVQQQCFCPSEYRQPMRVLVRDGKVVSANFLDSEENVVSAQVLQSLYTIQGWFSVISKASNDNAARLEAVYHPGLGYPEKIDIDMRERMVDDEQTITISSVVEEYTD